MCVIKHGEVWSCPDCDKAQAENERLVAERDEFFAYAAAGEGFPQVVDQLDHLRYHAKASEDAYKQAQAENKRLKAEAVVMERELDKTIRSNDDWVGAYDKAQARVKRLEAWGHEAAFAIGSALAHSYPRAPLRPKPIRLLEDALREAEAALADDDSQD